MFAVKNKDGLYYTKDGGFGGRWTTAICIAQKYTYADAQKSAMRHNAEVVEVDMYESGNGGYLFCEKTN